MSLFEQSGDPVTFDALVGEGKKYKTPDDLAKAKSEADRFIEQLKWEKQEALKTAPQPAPDRSQEILDQLRVLAEARSRAPEPVTERQPTGEPERTAVKSLTEDDVLRVLSERERKLQAQNNLNKVKDELVTKFGNNYGQVLKSLQDQMGVGAEFLDGIAAQSPAAFMKLIGDHKPEPVFTPPPSSTTAQSFTPTGSKHKPRSYYKKLRLDNKALYESPAVQAQMYKDAMALGEAYLDVPD